MIENWNQVYTPAQKDIFVKEITINLVDLVKTAKETGLVEDIRLAWSLDSYLTLTTNNTLIDTPRELGTQRSTITEKEYSSIIEKYKIDPKNLISLKNKLLKS